MKGEELKQYVKQNHEAFGGTMNNQQIANSTAMLMGMWERGERVDLILFADTGGEKPHTYEHIKLFNACDV